MRRSTTRAPSPTACVFAFEPCLVLPPGASALLVGTSAAAACRVTCRDGSLRTTATSGRVALGCQRSQQHRHQASAAGGPDLSSSGGSSEQWQQERQRSNDSEGGSSGNDARAARPAAAHGQRTLDGNARPTARMSGASGGGGGAGRGARPAAPRVAERRDRPPHRRVLPASAHAWRPSPSWTGRRRHRQHRHSRD